MGYELLHAKKILEKGLELYHHSSSLSDYKDSILHMHSGLDVAFRAYLLNYSTIPSQVRTDLTTDGAVSFPKLMDHVRDYSSLFSVGIDLRHLVSLNTTRNKIAHPNEGSLTLSQIENDARRFSEIINQLWSSLFESIPINSSGSMDYEHQSTSNLYTKSQVSRPNYSSYISKSWYRETGCMWGWFLFLTPIWAILILTDRDQGCFMKTIAVCYLLFLVSGFCIWIFWYTGDFLTILNSALEY